MSAQARSQSLQSTALPHPVASVEGAECGKRARIRASRFNLQISLFSHLLVNQSATAVLIYCCHYCLE